MYILGRYQSFRTALSDFYNCLLTRKNKLIETKVHLIHSKPVPLFHYTKMILCYDGDGLVPVMLGINAIFNAENN